MKGKKAFILGGTSSIGLKIARMLVKCGAKVTVAGRHDPKEDGISFLYADFNDFNQKGIASYENYLKDTDILIIAYGPFIQKPLEETTDDDWKNMALQNLALPGTCISAAVSKMAERGYGRIILFGGTRTDSVHNYKTNCAYAASKTGISVLIKSVAKEFEAFGVTCNGIFPGFTSHAPENTKEVSEEKIAECVKFLLENSELNGVLLNVDRGWQP